MIYTVTFNPALDYIIKIKEFKKEEINKAESEMILPGGKGINVSIVLRNLGQDSIALGFTSDFTGEEIKKRLDNLGVTTDFIEVKEGFCRINIKIISEKETAINGNGPKILETDVEELLKKIDNIKNGDILVLAGSVPQHLESNIYEKICKRIQTKNVKIVVDTTGELLINVLKYKPFLIKPNIHELGEIFGVEIESKEKAIEYAKKLQEKGARNVLVSMGENGAVLLDENKKQYYGNVPKRKKINTVGAGDSMVAGFLDGYIKTNSYETALKMGIATGSASACSKYLATKEEVIKLLQELKVKEEI